jgi:hypothetical protein
MFGLDLKKSFLFGKGAGKKKSDRAGTGTARLYLHCTETGWRSRLVYGDGRPAEDKSGEINEQPRTGERRIESAFRLAGAALEAAPEAKEVIILTDDPAVHYVDTLGEVFRSASKASPALLRKYGADELNAKRVTFGLGQFSAQTRPGRSEGVAAFADATGIGACLSRIDRLAARVAAICPLSDLLARRASTTGGEVYGAIHVGGWETRIVLVNPEYGAVTVRTLPVGVVGLLEALAAGMGVPLEDAVQSARRRDLPAEIDDGVLSAAGRDENRSQVDRIIGDAVRAYYRDIIATLDYFDQQRSSGRPERLEIFGEHSRLNGFPAALSRALDLPVEPMDADLLDLFIAAEHRLNLLENAGDQLLIGKASYALHQGRLTPSAAIPRPQVRAAAPAVGRNRRGGPSSKKESNSGFAEILSKLGINKNATAGLLSPVDEDAEQNERQYFLLFGFVLAALLYWGYDQYQMTALNHAATVANAAKQADESSRLRNQVVRNDFAPTDGGGGDKVLWTEKFLAIGANLDERMWLSDVYLTTETRSVAGASVLSKKLVIEGAVLPSTVGHILEVARFICRLENDPYNRLNIAPSEPVKAPPPNGDLGQPCKPGQLPEGKTADPRGFMGDFREIKFHGAAIDQNERDSIIRFRIEAWYDENKRLASAKQAASDGSPLGNMKETTQKHREEVEKSIK